MSMNQFSTPPLDPTSDRQELRYVRCSHTPTTSIGIHFRFSAESGALAIYGSGCCRTAERSALRTSPLKPRHRAPYVLQTGNLSLLGPLPQPLTYTLALIRKRNQGLHTKSSWTIILVRLRKPTCTSFSLTIFRGSSDLEIGHPSADRETYADYMGG